MSGTFRAVEMRTEDIIERLAKQMRKVFSLSGAARVSLIHLMEELEELLPDFVFQVKEDEFMHRMDGYSEIENYGICLSNSVYEALAEGDPNARFTAAHELGHLFMHAKRTTAYARRVEYHRHIDPEWQADYFADAFLMPRSGVLECESADEVAKRFSVPDDRAEARFCEVHQKQGELF